MEQAGHSSAATRLPALSELLGIYLPALERHLVLHLGVPDDRAQDIVQGFVERKIIEQEVLKLADRERGRFRNFLFRIFSNHVRGELRRDAAGKRRAMGADALRLDDHPDAVRCAGDPSTGFDAAWARQVLAEVMRRMRAWCERTGQLAAWRVFQARILGPVLDGDAAVDYKALVSELGFASPAQATNRLLTAKRMFRRLLMEVVRETVTDESQVEAEIADLKAALSGSWQGE